MRVTAGCVQCVVLAALLALASAGKPKGGPHPHQGLSKPYKPGKPDITLNAKELKQLQDGKLVQQSLTVGDGQGRALAVQDVHAPPEYVWDRILDFENYPKMVPKVSKCGNYEVDNLRNGTDIIKTRMVMNVFGVKFDNYILHKHYKTLDSLTWTLDYSRRSTLDDSVGFWYVTTPPDRPQDKDWSRVYYSCLLKVPSWVPGMVVGFLEKKAVSEANVWLKRESEAKFIKDQAAGVRLGKGGGAAAGGLFGSKPSAGGGFGGFKGWGAKPAQEVEVEAAPAAAVFDDADEDDSGIAGKALTVARKAATFGAGYGLGWFVHTRLRRPRPDYVEVDIIE